MSDGIWTAGGPRLRIAQLNGERVHVLRVRRPTDAERAEVSAMVGALPQPGEVTGDALRIFGMAPEEWMLVGALPQALRAYTEVGRPLCHLADVSEGRVVFSVSGPLATELLARGTSIDLHPSVFAPGRCAQTLFAQVHVMLEQVTEEPKYRIFADRSYALHLQSWFEAVAKQFVFQG